jgi:hypothetical protein
MSTTKTPEPFAGYRIATPAEVEAGLPRQAVVWTEYAERWSSRPVDKWGKPGNPELIYALPAVVIAEVSQSENGGPERFVDAVEIPAGAAPGAVEYMTGHPELPAALALRVYVRNFARDDEHAHDPRDVDSWND